MKILHVLNNNAVMCSDQDGGEIIAKGKGIAYGKKPGDEIDPGKVDKTFVASSPEISRRYQQILISIPYDCVEVSEKIIDVIKADLPDRTLSDKIYITLTDHIDNLIERTKQGIELDNSILWDVQRMYPSEYHAAAIAVEMIRDQFDIKIRDDEANFIALHIVNAEMNTEISDTVEVTAMISSVCDIVESYFDYSFDKNSLDYSRFILHLRVFFGRVISKSNYGSRTGDDLMNNLIKAYPKQYDCTMRIIEFVKQKYDAPLQGEVLYLLVHIIKLTEEVKR